MQVLVLALVLAQPPAVPQGPPSVPMGPPVVPMVEVEPARVSPYDQAMEDCRTNGTPVVAFVGTPSRKVSGLTHVTTGTLSDGTKSAVIVSTDGINGRWLPVNATDAQIRIAAGLEQPLAIPFSRRLFGILRRGEVQTADDDFANPQLAGLLKGMEQYTTATQTQTTFRRVAGYITPSPRVDLPNKWNVPGGLDNVHGWSSRLYKTKGVAPSVFLVHQDPNDTLSAVTWSRSYPDVSFADVLRNEKGEVFEVRMANKTNGSWERFVAFTNAHARPSGYVRQTIKDCRSCHEGAEQPGTSAYGGAAIPGADTIFSDPFDLLEAGRVVQGGNRTRL